MPDVKFLVVEVDSGNDPVFIAANVKHVVVANLIGCIKRSLDIRETHE